MFDKRIQYLRKKIGLTQEGIAAKFGIARTTYSGYERGTSEPDLKTLIEFADYFEVTIDYLIGRSDDPKMYFNNETEKAVYDLIELADESRLESIPMSYDGIELTLNEKKEFIAIAKGIFDVRRSMK